MVPSQEIEFILSEHLLGKQIRYHLNDKDINVNFRVIKIDKYTAE